ncbi:conserved hypothetical protein [uncultured Desulfatiglans sp.]|uniref:Uncharacterized protein n=1 Tax=Uncultured Desulfatiglans sp. TaxID=1748965 RepID=A0A653AD12_UNCDX|nr:conserved hypothetical protein [uncultured Desulfatiglans sp.]
MYLLNLNLSAGGFLSMKLHRKRWVLLVLWGLVSFLWVPAWGAPEQNPFSSLVGFLDDYAGTPFRVVGRVKEVGEGRLLFEKGTVSLKVGEWLCVSKEDPEGSPALKSPAAWIIVEALFPETALARVADSPAAPLSPGDRVVTPPPPRIHVQGDALQPDAAPLFEGLVRELLEKGYHLDMDPKGKDGVSAERHDLKLELLRGEKILVCRLSTIEGERVLYYRTAEATSHRAAVPSSEKIPLAAGTVVQSGAEAPPAADSGPSFQHSKPARSQEHFRLQEPVSRVVACRRKGADGTVLACLGEQGLILYELADAALNEVSRLAYPHTDSIPLHLHCADLDGDGGEELLVTLTRPVKILDNQDNRLSSWIVALQGGGLESLAEDLPFYFRVIRDRKGRPVPLAQRQGAFRQYEGPIYRVEWDKSGVAPKVNEVYAPAAGVYSLYQFSEIPEAEGRLVILESGGQLHGYVTPEGRLAAFGERDAGEYKVTGYPLRREQDLFLGGFDRRTYDEVFTARRLELRTDFDGQIFTINKGRGGAFSSVAEKLLPGRRDFDQVVAVKWVGERILQTWESDKYEKDLIDFTFLKTPDRILILCRDADGYALEALR